MFFGKVQVDHGRVRSRGSDHGQISCFHGVLEILNILPGQLFDLTDSQSLQDRNGTNLDDIHQLQGPADVGSAQNRQAVVLHEKGVVLLHEGIEIVSQLLGQGFAVRYKRYRTHLRHGLGKHRPHQPVGSFEDGKGIGIGWVTVDHRLDVRPVTVEVEVHRHLAGGLACTLHGVSLQVDEDHVLIRDIGFAHAGRGNQNQVFFQLDREIATLAGHVHPIRQAFADLGEVPDLIRVFL